MKTVVITGANRGIGLELVKRFIESGDRVFGLCRQSSDELKRTGAEVIEGVDVTSLESLKSASRKIVGINIDLLICNAGLLKNESIDTFGEEDIASCLAQFEVNTLGPLRTFSAFRRQLPKGARVAMITSRMGSIEDNTSGGHYGYRMSKCALNMATRSLVHDFKKDEIAFGLFHPGWVQTEMTGRTGHLSAKESSALLFKRMAELNMESTGGFWHPEGEKLPW